SLVRMGGVSDERSLVVGVFLGTQSEPRSAAPGRSWWAAVLLSSGIADRLLSLVHLLWSNGARGLATPNHWDRRRRNRFLCVLDGRLDRRVLGSQYEAAELHHALLSRDGDTDRAVPGPLDQMSGNCQFSLALGLVGIAARGRSRNHDWPRVGGRAMAPGRRVVGRGGTRSHCRGALRHLAIPSRASPTRALRHGARRMLAGVARFWRSGGTRRSAPAERTTARRHRKCLARGTGGLARSPRTELGVLRRAAV